mmetsp:Transcript_11315/g.37412  ORF Transcript_11315/g.37412 Transcript_11315/m.37412 type:complete len:281 (+) Transcript_11315:1976-2818(+)
MVLYEKYGILATVSRNQNRGMGLFSGNKTSSRKHSARYGPFIIKGAATCGRACSRSQIPALLNVRVSSSSRSADIVSASGCDTVPGTTLSSSSPLNGTARIASSADSVFLKYFTISPSSRVKFALDIARTFLGTPGGRVLLTSINAPALLCMYPYSHRTRANGEALNRVSASSMDSTLPKPSRCSTARANFSLASPAAMSATSTSRSSESSSGSSSRGGGRAMGWSSSEEARRHKHRSRLFLTAPIERTDRDDLFGEPREHRGRARGVKTTRCRTSEDIV